MTRTATSITVVGNLVRQAIDTPGGISQNLELQLTVKAADLLALLTTAEKGVLRGPGGNAPALIFSVALTQADGTTLLNAGTAPALREAMVFARVSPSSETLVALANDIAGTGPA